jgi:type I restriction enzyme S subunit
MASEWSSVRLAGLCDPERDITYGIVKVGDFVVDGVPVIRGGDIREGRIVFDEEKRVNIEVSQQFRRTILKGGEILINLIAEPGHTAIVPQELAGANVSRDVAVIALNDEIDHKYVNYCLKSSMAVNWLKARLQGSVTQKINLATLRDLPIPTPSRTEQHFIVRALGTLDDKIELNRKMNETLEAMARALFKSWFADFDPVRAKAEGRNPSLPASIAALFPDSFQDSELGEIPAGWSVLGLDETARFLNGLALQKFPPKGDRFLPVIKISQLRAGDVTGADKASADLAPEYVVEDGDVLFSWSGSLECVLWSGGRGALNQHLFKVTSEEFPKWFYFLWIHQHLDDFRQIAAGKATTMGHIQRHHLSAAKVVVPPALLLKEMSRHLAPLIDQIVQFKCESKALAAARDLLLPKLISGELRLDVVESNAGECA